MPARRGGERGDISAAAATIEKSLAEAKVAPQEKAEAVSDSGAKMDKKPAASSVLDTASPVTRDDLARHATFLSEHAQRIPNRERVLLLTTLMQDYMSEVANKAGIGDTRTLSSLGQDMITLEDENPSLRFILDFYLHQLALAHGQRLIDSRLIDESFRKARANAKRSWVKRVFRGGKNETAIIKEMEEKQAQLEVERIKLNELLAEIEKMRAEKDALRDKMQAEAKEIIARAEKEAEETRKRTEEERARVVTEAKTEAGEIKSEAKAEVVELKRQKGQLQIDVAALEAVKKELSANPDAARVYEVGYGRETMRQELANELGLIVVEQSEAEMYRRGRLIDGREIVREIQKILAKYRQLPDIDKLTVLRVLRPELDSNSRFLVLERWIREVLKEPAKMYKAESSPALVEPRELFESFTALQEVLYRKAAESGVTTPPKLELPSLPPDFTEKHLEVFEQLLGQKLDVSAVPRVRDWDGYISMMYPEKQLPTDTSRNLTAFRPSWWEQKADKNLVGGNEKYGTAYQRSIKAEAEKMAGSVFLTESLQKPNYTDGSQRYGTKEGLEDNKDPLLPIIQEALGVSKNRFNNNWDEVKQVAAKVKEKITAALQSLGLSVPDFDVIITPAIIANLEMVTKHPENSGTSTAEWSSTPLLKIDNSDSGSRLVFGGSDSGGAGYVSGRQRGRSWRDGGFRLSVVLKKP